MNLNLDLNLENAIKICNGKLIHDDNLKFSKIYPFTTENIAGYIKYFDLVDKSLLTVGSSGDQAINSILNGCDDVTLLDVNPYAKYYYYLKLAAIICLDIDEFLEFLRFKDCPRVFSDNKNVFNKKGFEKIKETLSSLDYESFLFWNELFKTFRPIDIRNNLFSLDEDRTYVITGCNSYLESEKKYNETRNRINLVKPNFINGDLFKLDLNNKYDNIWLSNIGTYLSRESVKDMTDIMSKLLNDNGQLMISYLYQTKEDTKYQEDWSPIYSLDKLFDLLKEYNSSLISFIGTQGLKFKDKNMKDSILVYRKHL